ncbi:hypothetical protein FRB93_013979 [Tulasnella sp. JGI-2019a]|nr:hypothetical protein FRB93_013979 [Tulasnella sp. JGI-2019a]
MYGDMSGCDTPSMSSSHLSLYPSSTPSPARISLLGLPTDVIISILATLDPPDVLSVRTACKLLAELTHEHAVWTGTLYRLCSRHAILHSTYPVNQLTSTQIERIALLPSRFEQLLLSGGSYEDSGSPPVRLKPTAIRTLHIDPPVPKPGGTALETEPIVVSSDVQMMRIIPGGRFVVIGTELGEVKIWDLGYDPTCQLKSDPLACIALNGPVNSIHVQASTPDSFTLAVEYKDGPDEESMKSWIISEVTIINGMAHLTKKAAVSGVQAEGYALMEGEYIAVEHVGAIFLWNWANDTWGFIERYLMNLEPPDFDARDQYRSTPHITAPYISIYDANLDVIVIFNLPSVDEMLPTSVVSSTRRTSSPPLLSLTPQMVIPMPYSAVYTIPIRQWQPSLGLLSSPAFMALTTNPAALEPLDGNVLASAAFIHLHIRRISPLGREMGVPMRVEQIRLEERADLLNAQALYSPSYGGRARVVTVWNAEEGMTTVVGDPSASQMCLASDPLVGSEGSTKNVMPPHTRPVILTEPLGPDARDRMAMSFCPLSGRVCMSIRAGEVMVMDYVNK